MSSWLHVELDPLGHSGRRMSWGRPRWGRQAFPGTRGWAVFYFLGPVVVICFSWRYALGDPRVPRQNMEFDVYARNELARYGLAERDNTKWIVED